MMKYIELKNGKFVAERIISAIGVEGDEIYVEYIGGGQSVSRSYTAKTEPCSIESVIVALRGRLAEQQE